MDNKPIIGISIGDINGIGPEVVIKTFADERMLGFCTPVIYSSPQIINYHKKAIGLQSFHYNICRSISDLKEGKVNLIQNWDSEPRITLGESSSDAGEYAVMSLNAACDDLSHDDLDAIVTAPVHKKSIQSKDFNFPGHTEFLKSTFEANDVLMMMVSDNMRVGLATSHVPLREVIENLTIDSILVKLRILEKSLREDFNIERPKIGVLGLNPHAGEEGMLGKEEIETIEPAIQKAKEEGMVVHGPFPADGYFGNRHFENFNGTLAMFHDQGLAPFKALAFESGVNYTAGMKVIRSSPDHGTGYDIAGKGVANEQSFREAVYLAVDVYKSRSMNKELETNQLTSRRTKEKERD